MGKVSVRRTRGKELPRGRHGTTSSSNSNGPDALFAKGRKAYRDPGGTMDGGNLGNTASDRQHAATCVLGKDWCDASKDAWHYVG